MQTRAHLLCAQSVRIKSRQKMKMRHMTCLIFLTVGSLCVAVQFLRGSTTEHRKDPRGVSFSIVFALPHHCNNATMMPQQCQIPAPPAPPPPPASASAYGKVGLALLSSSLAPYPPIRRDLVEKTLLEVRPTSQSATCGVRECWDTGTRIGTWCAPGGGGGRSLPRRRAVLPVVPERRRM